MFQRRRAFVKSLWAPLLLAGLGARDSAAATPATHKTIVSIVGNAFCVNGKPTYPGRVFQGV